MIIKWIWGKEINGIGDIEGFIKKSNFSIDIACNNY